MTALAVAFALAWLGNTLGCVAAVIYGERWLRTGDVTPNPDDPVRFGVVPGAVSVAVGVVGLYPAVARGFGLEAVVRPWSSSVPTVGLVAIVVGGAVAAFGLPVLVDRRGARGAP